MKKWKDKIAAFLYKIVLLLVKLAPPAKGQEHLLLIKNDEIGDYILFRNFLKDIRNSEQYCNYNITLVGNIIWKDIFDTFDSSVIDNVIWLSKKHFNKDLLYRYKFLKNIRRSGFSDVINCIYSRNAIVDDCFVEVVKCDNKVGMYSDTSNSKRDIRLYTKLIDSGSPSLFDCIRNKNFISKALNIPEGELGASVVFQNVPSFFEISQPYFVVFAGAGKQAKKWKPGYFAETIKYIADRYTLLPVLLGGSGDIADSKAVKGLLSIQCQDYTGKLSMSQSLSVLKSAKFSLSVDTGSVHMSSGVDCITIALYSGVHYGRFAPYPKDIFNKFHDIYPDEVDILIQQGSDKLIGGTSLPYTLIQNITPSKVISCIDKVLV